MRNYERLERFLNERQKDIYPELEAEPNISITRQMVPNILQRYDVPKDAKILDVGCGTGLALNEFRAHGYEPMGIGFGEEAAKAREAGFEIVEQDMSFLDFADGEFDLIWCRHVIEHSVFPYFTLSEMFRMLKPSGVFYMEVPSPDTDARHETNANHYSVLGSIMWESLLHRVGFSGVRRGKIDFDIPSGKDAYLSFDARKPA